MHKITISISDDSLSKLTEIATHLGITPEDLLQISVAELSTRPEEAFQQAVDYVLKKNAALYQRLA